MNRNRSVETAAMDAMGIWCAGMGQPILAQHIAYAQANRINAGDVPRKIIDSIAKLWSEKNHVQQSSESCCLLEQDTELTPKLV